MNPTDRRSVYRGGDAGDTIRRWCDTRLREWRTDHGTRRVSCEDATVHLTCVGSGPTRVVLVPGTNFNAATSRTIAAALGAHWRTVVVDLPGQPGLSDPHRPRTPHDGWYGRILTAALEAIDARDVVVVGHSLGAAVAASARSDRIAARLLCSPAGITRLRMDPVMLRRSTAWLLAPTWERSRRLLELFTAPGTAPETDTVEWLGLVAKLCRSSLAPPPQPAAVLRACGAAPLIVATGEHDRFLPPRVLEPAVRRRLDTSLRVIPEAGHLLVEERPEEVVAMVAELAER
ncbi:pimeloyl-ACP methyl ester carboxylesterase [Stackebrandtia albiflava]|uniref:Pimeloyl-ACP methyl ester carboxylesterase n=1 Tax=Stackebrandtia albiflava TaxID=406432 RepID=A0A562UL06_9ACTN|nr:alpha/beta hydrolase [Stackebrandtia albiflava]TWJ06304.1 pimeloyl-ACP methyl ester carboxylesterase [Stackebrandtia albiflava]